MIQPGICKKRLSVYHSWIFDLNFGPERFSQSILASHFVPTQWQPASLVLHNDNLTSGTYVPFFKFGYYSSFFGAFSKIQLRLACRQIASSNILGTDSKDW